MATIGELLPSRRELLKFGGLGIAGASAYATWPLKLRANPAIKTKPRGTARNVVFFEISGAIRKPTSVMTLVRRRAAKPP